MPGYAALADVGDTLVQLLQDEMGREGPNEVPGRVVDKTAISLVSPAEVAPGGATRLGLFLYRLSRDGQMSNEPSREIAPNQYAPPSLALELTYLLTAYPSTGGPTDTAESKKQHTVLGRAVQVLQDNALIDGAALSGDLTGELHVSIFPEAFEDLTGLWSTFDERPYQPSVSLLVTPVTLPSERVTDAGRVVERRSG